MVESNWFVNVKLDYFSLYGGNNMNNFLSASIKINGVKYDAFELDDPCVKVNITQMGEELLAGYTVTLPAPQTSLIVEYIKIR